ncbi:hypothetical protein EMN47_11585 [Prolixibacteraceae bacterium JC049]|nr:hypothetical protein [Prolixibacteraceae bacterium JC049]
MKQIRILLITVIAAIAFVGCEEALMSPKPKVNNIAVFDEYVKLVKEKYAMLEFKQVDIDALSQRLRKDITNDMSKKELFEKMGEITQSLKDGHSSLLEVPEAQLAETSLASQYDFLKGYPAGFDLETMLRNYIGKDVNKNVNMIPSENGEGVRIAWTTLPKHDNIAYVWVPTWNEEISMSQIEEIFAWMKDKKGLILDMRQNTGGDPELATRFASYFLKGDTKTGFERFKIGPAKGDFKDSPTTLKPAKSENLFHKKVMVLVDRYVYSAATTFCYSVDPLEHVTFVGQRTGGGSGAVADGYLMNGWYWSLSVSEYIDARGRHLDNGFEPDIPVVLDLKDQTKDEVIERAIVELNKQ